MDVLAIKSRLGGFNAYMFFAEARKLLPISFVNHRGLRDIDAAPTYQRLVQRDRLLKIADFVKKGGYFPNSVIVNFKKPISFNKVRSDDSGNSTGILTLPDAYKSVWIIDGQHRLYGYSEISPEPGEPDTVSQIPILAFESISTAEETRLFSDINSKQKTVAKKLLDEITGDMKLNSGDRREQLRAVAVRALDLLRSKVDGALYGKIAGAELSNPGAQLAIPYLADAIGQSALLGRFTKQEGTTVFLQGHLFWDDPKMAVNRLAIFLDAYLDVFRARSSERWDLGKQARFASNTGVAGLIRFANDVISFMSVKEKEDPRTLHPKILVERLEPYLEPVASYFASASLADVADRFATPFGAGGPAAFQFRLRELTHSAWPEFSPTGFDKDLREHSATRVAEADRKVRAIQEQVQGYVLTVLKKVYLGENYLEEAVDNKEMLKKTYEKYLDNDPAERKELATYLDFLDLRKIVETPKNWEHFSDKLNIPLPEEKKGKARYVSWFDEVNKIRRIPAHPFNRAYSDTEVLTLDAIYGELAKRGVIS
nr:DGQHR domain-containing protein [Caulobacter sp. SLTY]